jgi:phytoene dehydrogenase-like protein
MTPDYDVIIIGGGHNGLVAAGYLAKAGKSVLVLERQPVFGGAAVSAEAFPGVPARLSRYSYLVSLFPKSIMADLGMTVELRRRRYSSYTPVPGDNTGLLVDAGDQRHTEDSFRAIGAPADYTQWTAFYDLTQSLAQAVFPTMVEPLLTRSELKRKVAQHTGSDRAWSTIVDTPLEETVTSWFHSDVVRGVVATDGLIGTFPENPSDDAVNRCFLYHVIGGGTGDWDVPVGGMGQVTGSLARIAYAHGATMVSSAEVTEVDPEGSVTWTHDGSSHRATSRLIISGLAPSELGRLTGSAPSGPPVEGAQVKVNLVVSSLPRLLDSTVTAEHAFGGTFHINETLTQLQAAWSAAKSGQLPDPVPAEIYCHSLTDPSILDPALAATGAHTLTVFALHTPHRLIAGGNPNEVRADLQARVIASLNSVLAEPIEDLLLPTSDGGWCVETKTTIDLEESLRLPGGNIFHQPLDWPFLADEEDASDPATRWGVATKYPRLLLGGSGARRGGGVSGIGGHNAAMAALEIMAASGGR